MPTLLRLVQTPLYTKGVLIHDNDILCHTLELPWNNNQRNISCIPTGVYDVSKSNSDNFGSVLRFSSVLNRTGILFHAGNTTKDTRGCILVGLDANSIGVIHSKQAMYRILQRLPSTFKLTVKENLCLG